MGIKLEVKHLTCGYAANVPVVENATFTVQTGEICCLLGPNGVGKTTLFKTILQLMPALGGEIILDGENISSWSPQRLSQVMAYVAQLHVPPFPYKVKDVVLLGRVTSTGYFKQPSPLDIDIANQAMEDMGVWEMRDRIYTDVSGGERQLVMIARALAQEPQILVMDEPTASLDYGNQIRVINKIRSLKERGYGIIMTTHSPDQAFLCDSNVVLLQRNHPMLFGPAFQVITERNLNDAYGVHVKVMEFHDFQGRVMRMCAPTLD